jgi:hypothetical protein
LDILAGGDEELHLNKRTPHHLRRRKDFGAKCWIKEIVAKNDWGDM